MFRRCRAYLKTIEWSAIVGSGLILAFCLLFLIPLEQHYAEYQHQSRQRTEAETLPQKADDRIADYTLWLAYFTGALVIVTTSQILFLIRADYLTRKSLDLARQEFIASHRPRVVLRTIEMSSDVVPPLGSGDTIGVVIHVVNVGETPAEIEWIVCAQQWRTVTGRWIARDQIDHEQPKVEGAWLASGQRLVFQMEAPMRYDFIMDRLGEADAFIWGTIVYVDDNDVRRQTGFIRQFETESCKFIRVNDPDYDYQD